MTEVEENFYARCLPEKRPEFYGSRTSPSASPKEETVSELIMPLQSDDNSEKNDDQKETSQPKKSCLQMKLKTFKTDSKGNRKI